LHTLAVELNDRLKGTVPGEFLSAYGKRMYFPKGIVAQSAEAKSQAKLYNATVGQAFKDGHPMYLSSIYDEFTKEHLTTNQIFTYAPGGGEPKLRELWKADMLEKNPGLEGKTFSRPLVTAGLTHAISMICRMFLDEDDTLLVPDLFWDNYDLIVTENVGASLTTFPLFDDSGRHFNLNGLEESIAAAKGKKLAILLNFPNTPTGYTPTKTEMKNIADLLLSAAEKGQKMIVIDDDAYFGLFYEADTARESLFSYLADAHPNILAIKGDAATKEAMVWGFRIGFITVSCKGLTADQYDAIEKKFMGAIRCSVSNCDKPGQNLLVMAMSDRPSFLADKKKALEEMERRYRTLQQVLADKQDMDCLKPLAFNSGYFMSFTCKGDPEELRKYLLSKYQIGAINIMGKVLRLAYCSVEETDIRDLIDKVYKAAGELWD
jgi:aspartate/methionine/tyrosine aminotransferase